MNPSLRSRLLLGIAATTIVGFAAASLVIFVVIRASLEREFDALLAGKARALSALVQQQGDTLDIAFADYPMPEFTRKVRPEYFQVWDEDGTVLARSRRLGSNDLPHLAGASAVPGYQFDELPDGRSGRLIGIQFFPMVEGENLDPLLEDEENGVEDDEDVDQVDFTNRRRVTLVVARETAVIDRAAARLAWLLLGVSAAMVFAILIVLAQLLRRSLQPLAVLSEQISDVNEAELSFRFGVPGLPRELGPVVGRLNELLGRLEEAFQRERVLTADVAHELRTPLAGLRSTLEVTLSRARENGEYEDALRTCEVICGDTQRLIETLLSISRVETGQAMADRTAVDIANLVAAAWETYCDRADARNLEVDLHGPMGLILTTDPAQLRIVLANLFDNAVDYADEGGSIKIEWRADDAGFELTVCNSGCELNEEQMANVFSRFWRADAARVATGTHAGLGLSLCQKLIILLDGSIVASINDGDFVVAVRFGAEFVEHADCVSANAEPFMRV